MKIRIEAETPAELDVAEALLRLVFSAGPASEDCRNRRRRHGEQRVPGWRRYVDKDVKPITRLSLYDVVCGNYEPAEVDSTHIRREPADKRAEELGGMWHVVAYGIDLSVLLPAAVSEACVEWPNCPGPMCPVGGQCPATAAAAGSGDDDQAPAAASEPARVRVCAGAVCTVEPCVYRVAGECGS